MLTSTGFAASGARRYTCEVPTARGRNLGPARPGLCEPCAGRSSQRSSQPGHDVRPYGRGEQLGLDQGDRHHSRALRFRAIRRGLLLACVGRPRRWGASLAPEPPTRPDRTGRSLPAVSPVRRGSGCAMLSEAPLRVRRRNATRRSPSMRPADLSHHTRTTPGPGDGSPSRQGHGTSAGSGE